MVWQMMVALLRSNGQLRTERDGDTEKGCLSVLDLSPMYATGRRQTRIIVECLRPMERGIKPWAGSILNMEQRRH